MTLQTIEHKKGEVAFRRKLAVQHVAGDVLIPDYFTREEHDAILRERMETTRLEMAALTETGLCLTPFLELGAERGQRSLVLTNDFGARGFAVDISFDQLRTAAHFSRLFGKPALPYRVCCDATRLPFRSGVFPFAFCYEFLHHFPTPAPVLREVHRVLGKGSFYFNEEPFRRPRVILYHQRRRSTAVAMRQRSAAVRFLERFVSEECCAEREHGILENHDLTLDDWRAALAVFRAWDVRLSSLGGRLHSRLGPRPSIRNLPNVLLGGGIGGICRNDGPEPAPVDADLTSFLLCPDCAFRPEDPVLDQPPLAVEPSHLRCTLCGARYPVVDGITVLLPSPLIRELYPEFAALQRATA